MRQRLTLLSLLAMLLAACAAPSPPPAATERPTMPTSQPPTPDSQPPTPDSQPPTPTPSGPIAPLGAWGEGVPLDAAYTPDGQSVAVLRPGGLELRPATGRAELRWRIDLPTQPAALAVTPDGQTLAVAAGGAVDLYAVADGAAAGSIPGLGSPITAIAISPDGRLLAAAQQDEVISLWDIAERSLLSELRLPHAEGEFIAPGAFTSVAFAPDGQSLVAGDDGGNVGVWALSDGVALQVFSIGLRVVADVAFAPDGASVAAASAGWRSEAGSIWIWDAASGAELHRLTIDSAERFLAPARRLAFSRDGAHIFMGLADGELLRWSFADLAQARDMPGHSAAITVLAVAPDGGMLSAARDGSLRSWGADGAPGQVLPGLGAISALAVSPDGGLVISGDEGGAIDIRRPDGAPVAQIAAPGGPIAALAVAPDGLSVAAACADGVVRLWSLPDGAAVAELSGHIGPVGAVAFAPDGARLASVGADGTLRLWRIAAAAAERAAAVLQTDGLSSAALHQVAFTADGQLIAVVGDEPAVSLWRSADLTLVERHPVAGALSLSQVALAPDGGMLARDSGGQIYRWKGAEAAAPILSPGSRSFAILPSGDLATLGGDSLTIWRGPADALASYAQAPAPDDSALAAGPGIVALGSRHGHIAVWAVR